MSNIVINSNLLIIIAVVISIIIVSIVGYIIYKDRKRDKEEIEELLQTKEKEENTKIETEENKEANLLQIEEVLSKMQKDLETKPEEVVATFEREQEEKAIISYQELVKTLKKGKEENVVKIEDQDLEPKDNIEKIEENNIGDIVEEIKQTNKTKKSKQKFKNTEFISPVYGKMSEKLEYPKIKNFKDDDEFERFDEIYESYNLEDYIEEFSDSNLEIDTLEQTLDLEPISNEIKKNEEFLKALKEFRENL